MYPPDYETGDEYDSPCDKYGCGFATHHPACSHYTPPEPPKSKAEIEAELNKPVRCLLCDKVVPFREVKDYACCRSCLLEEQLWTIVWVK